MKLQLGERVRLLNFGCNNAKLWRFISAFTWVSKAKSCGNVLLHLV